MSDQYSVRLKLYIFVGAMGVLVIGITRRIVSMFSVTLFKSEKIVF